MVASTVWERPCSRIGFEQFPTRASASDQASKSRETNRSLIWCCTCSVTGGRSSGASSPWPGNTVGKSAGRVSVTAALVLVLTGVTTLRGVPRG